MNQYEIFVVGLDPTMGSEMKKTRPCIIISPNEMNGSPRTVQIAPLTTATRPYPWRVPITLRGKRGMIALDQIRTIDKQRLVRKVGSATRDARERIKPTIREMLVQ